MRALLAVLLAFGLAAPSTPAAWPRHSSGTGYSQKYRSSEGTSHTYRTGSSSHYRSSTSSHRRHLPTSPGSVRRDASGKIHRDLAQRAAFRRDHPCPSTGRTSGACPGYEVDHVKPLACGGADDPSNMQWLTKEANRAKGSEGCRL